MQTPLASPVPAGKYHDDIESVIIDPGMLNARITELAARVSAEYGNIDDDIVLVCVLKGAMYFITDLSRELTIPSQLEFMAVSSYGNSASSSGVVRILKDLDRDISGKHVLIVEDIIDSGLTLSWLMKNLSNRQPASLKVVTLLRKPDAISRNVELLDVGFDIPNAFVVGYGLDYAEHYRDLPYIGLLKERVYKD